MVSLTFTVLILQLLIPLPLVFSAEDLQYECIPGTGNEVQIEILKASNNLATFNLTKSTLCTKPTENTTEHFLLTGCKVGTDIPIEFTSLTKDNILMMSKDRMYTLNCQKDEKPVTRIVSAASFGVTKPTPTAASVHHFQQTKWVPKFTMSVTPSDSVVIGSQLEVTITSSDSNYKFAAKTCKATSDINTDSHGLWNSDDCSKVDGTLFNGPWSEEGTTNITHTLEAFRFADSHKLQLECTVMVCPKGQGTQCTNAYSCQNTRRRRRREATSRTAKTTVKTTLYVQDYLKTNMDNDHKSSPNSGAGSFLATSTLVCTAVTIYKVLT